MLESSDADPDCNGYVTYREFKHCTTNILGLKYDTRRMQNAWDIIDADNSDEVKFLEFAEHLFPDIEPDEVEAQLARVGDRVRGMSTMDQKQLEAIQRQVGNPSNSEAGAETDASPPSGEPGESIVERFKNHKQDKLTVSERFRSVETTLHVVAANQEKLQRTVELLIEKVAQMQPVSKI